MLIISGGSISLYVTVVVVNVQTHRIDVILRC